MEPRGEHLEPSPSFHRGVKQESVPARELGFLTAQGLERIYDLKQADRFLKSVGSGLPVERKQELDKSLSLHLEEQVGWNIGAVTSPMDPSERSRITVFLAKWDRETPEVKNRRISTAIELLGDEKLDPKVLEAKNQTLVNDVARFHEAKTHQNVRALSDKEIREWDELCTRQELKPVDQQRLKELEGRAILERDKALGAIGMQQGPVPLLVNSEVRKRYEQLLKDKGATEKIKALEVRLQIGKAPEAQAKEASIAFTHETFRELLLKRAEDARGALRKSGDYRLWILPMHSLDYAEKQLIPTITADNNDLDGSLRLIQSMMDSPKLFAQTSVDSPRVGALRELAGMLPRKEITGSKISNLSQEVLNERKVILSKELDDFDGLLKRSGDIRLLTLPIKVCDTAKTLLGEITTGAANQSGSGMIEGRLNTIKPILENYKKMYMMR